MIFFRKYLLANLVEIIKKDNYFAIKYTNGICEQFDFNENQHNFAKVVTITLDIPYINNNFFSIATPIDDLNGGRAPMMTCSNRSCNSFLINLSADYSSNYKWHTVGFWK